MPKYTKLEKNVAQIMLTINSKKKLIIILKKRNNNKNK